MFNIPFFSGQNLTVIRFSGQAATDGRVGTAPPRAVTIPGQVQPATDLRNVRDKFGEKVTAAIYASTPRDYPLSVQTGSVNADVLLYRGQFWKVQESILYDQLIPHHEATAILMDHPDRELTAFLPGRIVTQSGEDLTTESGDVYVLE